MSIYFWISSIALDWFQSDLGIKSCCVLNLLAIIEKNIYVYIF